MPIYQLDRRPIFPPAEHAEPEGILAVGGDLSVTRLLEAYRNGIFPWFDPGEMPLWWSPDPRPILMPGELTVSRSLRATVRKGIYEVRIDTAFRRVIHECSKIPRKHEDGTWIGRDIERAYSALHDLGYAHSFESWCEGELVGGLYGVSIGRAFFGESMFAHRSDASKVAVVALNAECQRRGIELIDGQVVSPHLLSLGFRPIPRAEFLRLMRAAVAQPAPVGTWAASS